MPDVMGSMLVGGVLALAISAALSPLVIRALRRRQLLDIPGSRSLHSSPTPRGGGVAPVAGVVIALLLSQVVVGPSRHALLLATLAFAVIGLAEDVRGLSPLLRLALQASSSLLAIPWLLHSASGSPLWRTVLSLGVVFWMVAYVNAYNFMDGINGISAAQAVVAGVTWYAIGQTADVTLLAAGGVMVAGAALGFAPFNFPRARVFLGDVGSYGLGALLAALAVVGLRAGLAPEAVLAPLALYGVDTATTLARRIRRRERWYEPHRQHAYQRLIQLGWSQTRTTLFVALVMTTCGVLGAVSLEASTPLRALADTALGVALIAYVLTPAFVARTQQEGTEAASGAYPVEAGVSR